MCTGPPEREAWYGAGQLPTKGLILQRDAQSGFYLLVPSQQIAAEMQFVGSPGLAKLCQWTYPAHHVGTPLAKLTRAILPPRLQVLFPAPKGMLDPGSRFRMVDDLLETYLRQLLERHGAP